MSNQGVVNSNNGKKANLKNQYIKYFIFSDITDNDNIFLELANLDGVLEVDLSDNQLTKLPSDLSNFTKLQSLDITNNPFKSVI